MTIDNKDLFKTGMKHYQTGNLTLADKSFREILAADPNHADALHMMATIGYDVERYDLAEGLMQLAITQDVKNSDYYTTLAKIYKKQDKTQQAFDTNIRAIDLNPKNTVALIALGDLCRDQGVVHRDNQSIKNGIEYYRRALIIRPNEDVYNNLRYLYQQLNQPEDAIKTCKECLKHFPRSASTFFSLAATYNYISQYEEALHYYKRALEIEPDNAEYQANMAYTLKNVGRLEESIEIQKKAVAAAPTKAWMYSNLIFSMLYNPTTSPEELAQTSRDFGKNIADPLIRDRPFLNDRSPDRKLRIGFISPDFRDHAVNFFLAPMYNLDKSRFETFAYSNTEHEDQVTDYLKRRFDHWRDIKYTKDDPAADLVEKDQIDILVDVTGHTAKNGLLVFARKPAPVQVSWLGHPATTGMKAIDYRITDSYAEPEGMTEYLNTETLWRMPDIFCVYWPYKPGPDPIDSPPFKDNGYITFGCFNNFSKVSDETIRCWARIMDGVPNSRLLIEIAGIQSVEIRKNVEERFVRNGLPLDRVDLEVRHNKNQFVLYNKVDMTLDPFPCVGGTTSMDSLWMGVPFVTLAGRHFASRMGVSILTNAGLSELIADSVDDYVAKAVKLANDPDRLTRLRDGLRERVKLSPLMDQPRFVKNIEVAFRAMWKIWCEQNP